MCVAKIFGVCCRLVVSLVVICFIAACVYVPCPPPAAAAFQYHHHPTPVPATPFLLLLVPFFVRQVSGLASLVKAVGEKRLILQVKVKARYRYRYRFWLGIGYMWVWSI